MHREHDIFVKAIRDKKRVKLTFLTNELGDVGDGLFGPLFYSTSSVSDDSGCYYLWNFESPTGNNFLSLSPSQILSMELTEEPFDLVEFFTSNREVSDP